MTSARVPSSEQLMAEMGWLRRLARSLVRDAATADDVAQETWLVAHAQQPAADWPLRPWLARVVVKLVHTRRRSEARRGMRDAAYDAESEARRAVATPADLVERVELQRMLADEVLALAEPYRSTVLLHFIEGLSSAEIARRLDVPDGTVRRRLKVALERLREALRQRTDRPKRGWLAALVPFADAPRPTPLIGVLAMKKTIGIVVALVLLLIGAGVLLRGRGGDEPATLKATGDGAASTPSARTAGSPDRTTIPSWVPQVGAPARRIAGRVVFRGRPVPGARVRLGFVVTGETTDLSVLPDSVPNVLQPIAEVIAGADGTFDFGKQPAALFTVSADAKDRSAGATHVANADPKAPSDRLVIELRDCSSRLHGVIADASGGGIAKARISVAGLSGTESGADGTYSACLAARRGSGTPRAGVRIEADGYGTIKQDVIVVGELRHDFLLVPEAVLVGQVTTADGQPVPGARILAASEPLTAVASGWTHADRDGRFRIAGLAPGTFELSATAPDLGTTTSVTAVARATATSREIQLVVAPLARVHGYVVENGVPVSGATITTVHDHVPHASALSQVDGSFVISAVPYGSAKLVAHPYRIEAPTAIEITRAVVEDVRVEVTQLGRVRGRVMRDNKPVAAADVLYIRAPQATFSGPPLTARTDATGAFAIDGLPAGPGRLLAWDDAGKAFSSELPLDAVAGETRTVDIELGYAGQVKGIVVDETSAPLAGVYVRLDLADGSDDACEAMTDANGQFDCAMLVGGTYRPTVSPLPGARASFAPARGAQLDLVEVPAAGVASGIRLAVKNELLAIRGSVIDDTGAPVADVHVSAIGRGRSSMDFPSAMTDATGRFVIENLARGTYSVHAKGADGGETEVAAVAAGSEPTTIELARAGSIEGTLVGFTTTPIVLATAVNAARPVGGRAIVERTAFSKAGLSPGRYTVEAHAGPEVDGQTVHVRAGETTRITLRSRGIGTIEGTVAELGTRKPLAAMRCDARLSMDGRTGPSPPDVSQQAFTDEAGRFVVEAPLGRVQVFCFSPHPSPLTPASAEVEVTSGARAKAAVFSVRASGDTRGDAGFSIAPLALPLTVNQVVANGRAAKAGLRIGDQIDTIDGVALQGVSPTGAMTLISNHRPGSTVTLGISRAGAAQVLEVVVGD